MIENISSNGNHITLRKKNTPNLFDIDSLSLLIGKNGSGKTETLKSIVNKFRSPNAAAFEDTCVLYFTPSSLIDHNSQWGAIYYTPVQHRPKFKPSKNFLDASNKKSKTIFQLFEHPELIKEFDINTKIKASLTIEKSKIGLLLADALIDNESFRGPQVLYSSNEFLELRNTKMQLSNLTDTKGDFAKEAKTQFANARKQLSLYILSDLESKNSYPQFLSTFAVVTHLITKRNSSIRFLIELMIRTLETSTLSGGQIDKTSNRLANAIDLIAETLFIYNSTKNSFIKKTVRTYECSIDPTADRQLFEKDTSKEIYNLTWPEMSSGQWSLLSQVINIYEALEKLSKENTHILLLIDEGDAFLHLEWQRNYILQLNTFLGKLKKTLNLRCLQLIIATHSPLLASDIPSCYVCQIAEQKKTTHTPTFAAPLQMILNRSFNSKSIGALATKTINKTIHNIKSGNITKLDRYIASIIDDPVIQNEIKRYISEAEELS